KALSKLGELADKGQIPNTTIPVLEERLKAKSCICGESLDPGEDDGKRRVDHIQHLIDASREADELKNTITDLYFGSRTLQPGQVPADDRWLAVYTKIVERRDELAIIREDHGKKLKALEAQLDAVPDTNVQGLRDTKRQYSEQRDRFNAARSRHET